MSSSPENQRCERSDLVASYALAALDGSEMQIMAAHLRTCAECQKEYAGLGPVTDALTAWRTQVLPAPAPLWNCLQERIANQTQKLAAALRGPPSPGSPSWAEPRWEEVAAGISCKLLSTDVEVDRVTMLVRLARGASYPPHRHASVEELYLLEGELWIDDRKLSPGDYNRAEQGTSDQRVWSPSGCICLLITSPSDELG